MRGFAYDVVNAVLGAEIEAATVDIGFSMTWSARLPRLERRSAAEAVSEVRGSEDFASISVAFKRMKNILRQARETNKTVAEQLDARRLTEDAEKQLAAKIPEIAARLRRIA